MKKIKNISICFTTNIPYHQGNNGDKFMNNENQLKMNSDGKVYFSPQTIRYNTFENFSENCYKFNEGEYFSVANTAKKAKDKTKPLILTDLRVDLQGDMVPSVFRRTSVLKTTPAFALEKSKITQDFLVNFDPSGDGKNNIVNNNISENDVLQFNFSIDSNQVLRERVYVTKDDKIVESLVDYDEDGKIRKDRVIALLRSIQTINGFANQSRYLIDPTPEKIIVSINYERYNNKAINFYTKSLVAQKNVVNDLKKLGSNVIFGDDETETSAFEAIDKAIDIVENSEL